VCRPGQLLAALTQRRQDWLGRGLIELLLPYQPAKGAKSNFEIA
jgi:hypothetical protein